MIDLTAWSLLIDILLMGSLMYLAYRLTRAESVAVKIDKVGDLEKTLRKIINDAEESSIALDQKLRARQKDLETLLEDLKSLEERVNSSFESSNLVKARLEKGLEDAKGLIKKLASLASMANKDRGYLYKNEGQISANSLRSNNDYLPIELEDSVNEELENRVEQITRNNLRSTSNIKSNNENILISSYKSKTPRNYEKYEEDEVVPQEKRYLVKNEQVLTSKPSNSVLIKKENTSRKEVERKINKELPKKEASSVLNQSASKQSGSLSSKIEKEVYTKASSSKDTLATKDLESIKFLKNRELALALLKRNIPIDVISLKTNISVNELLKMKDNTVSDSEINKIVTSSDDARLGVLSKMRREIATL